MNHYRKKPLLFIKKTEVKRFTTLYELVKAITIDFSKVINSDANFVN